ncbi:unnamed protein product [Brachionus calyciflorus]|uniref:EF-hand domain-containing protein n=1 Tax=Brachionus calyciflorus TaxID=104777 RepID=A0A813M3E5_9BILA|nr:unnamed protein product [Brachionus calyciflorus]
MQRGSETLRSLNSLSGYQDLDMVVETALRKTNLADQPVAYQTVSEGNLPERRVVQTARTVTAVLPSPTPLAPVSQDRNCSFLPPISLDQYKLNSDPNPEVIRKKPSEKVRYQQEVSVRFLEPPQPPKPGDIVVKHLPNRQIAPAPPLVVRQAPPRPADPAPLVIREVPPQPPQRVPDQLVLVPGKVLAPPARKVVVERLPQIPPKPQNVFLEKWLPFKNQKRRVVYQRPEPDCVLPNPRNLVIQWDAPEVEVNRVVKNLGTQQANPEEYVRRFGSELLRHEDFRQAATKFGAPQDVVVSNSHVELGLPELEGDVESLRLVDLDKSGLREYRTYLSGLGVQTGTARSSTGLGLVTSASSSNLVTMDQAQSTLNNLNGGTEKLLSDNDLRAYFNSLDTNQDGVLSYEEVSAAF